MENTLKHYRTYLGLFLIYLIVHSFLLLNKSFYWDDWIWVLNPNEFRIALNELGVVFFKDSLTRIVQWPIVGIKSFVFCCFFFSGIFLYNVLKKLSFLDPKLIFFTTALYFVMPFNIIGRSTICTIPYAVSVFFLFLGLLTYLEFRLSKKYAWLILALPALTFSFNTTSVLVVYIAAMMALELALGYNDKVNLRQYVKRISIVFGVVLIHTVIFFYIKNKYFPVHGVYADYNKVGLTPMVIARLFFKSAGFFLEPLAFSFGGKDFIRSKYLRAIYVLLFYLPAALALVKKNRQAMWVSLVGIGLVLAAIFPYLAVDKYPTTLSWDSRHQLLIPVGGSIWFFGAFMLIQKEKIRQILFVLLLVFFSFGTTRMYLSVQGLRYQDLSLQSELNKIIDPQKPGSYVLSDRGRPPGVMDHDWNFYEFTGMIYKNKGTQQDFLILASHMGTLTLSGIPESFGNYKGRYMVTNVKWTEPYTCLKMNELVRMNEWAALSMLFDEVTNDKQIVDRIANVYRLDKFQGAIRGPSVCDGY